MAAAAAAASLSDLTVVQTHCAQSSVLCWYENGYMQNFPPNRNALECQQLTSAGRCVQSVQLACNDNLRGT